jgi:hypothetical protein
MSMIRVAVGDKHYRTKSIDRIARRLYGPKAQAVVQENREGRIYGLFVTPDRRNPAILNIRDRFAQEIDQEATGEKVSPEEPKSQGRSVLRTRTIVSDDEGHKVSVYE